VIQDASGLVTFEEWEIKRNEEQTLKHKPKRRNGTGKHLKR
jgi:hypothetical protein